MVSSVKHKVIVPCELVNKGVVNVKFSLRTLC